MLSFSDPVQYLKGVGPARGKAFQALGVFTVEDLLRKFAEASGEELANDRMILS